MCKLDTSWRYVGMEGKDGPFLVGFFLNLSSLEDIELICPQDRVVKTL